MSRTPLGRGTNIGLRMQKETRENAIERCKRKIPAGLCGLFSEPPLLEGEDPNLYWGSVEAVIDERKPETASDWIAVNDLVTKLWEERLLRQASNALVRGGMIQKIGNYMAAEENGSERVHGLQDAEMLQLKRAAAARRWLEDYYKKNPNDRTPVASLLARFGMTEPELYAKVFEGNREVLQTFERMIAARERGRRKLRKEDERRRWRQGRQKAESK
jgi:hypothetical protein